jgi:hypothetical protein
MIRQVERLLIAVALAALLAGCRTVSSPAAAQTDCGSDDPRVGETAEFNTMLHGVKGTARIVDNCTIEITHFYYDGIGIDTRFVDVTNGDYWNTAVLSDDIRRPGGYTDETMIVKLLEGIALDDVPVLSVNCVRVGASFGDAIFPQP